MLKTMKKNYLIFLPIAFIAVIAQVDKYDQLTTSGTFGAAIRLAIPICRESEIKKEGTLMILGSLKRSYSKYEYIELWVLGRRNYRLKETIK